MQTSLSKKRSFKLHNRRCRVLLKGIILCKEDDIQVKCEYSSLKINFSFCIFL